MLPIIITLLVAGMILIGLEIFLPGAILGILGGCAFLAASILAFQEYGVLVGGLVGALSLFLSVGMLVFEFTVLPKTKLGRGLFLTAKVDGNSSDSLATQAEVVGKEGRSLTTLAPSGKVEVDGQEFEAFSEDGLLSKGTAVEVVGRDNFRLIVRKKPL
ncbi:MAG: NfeD family protein [Opitutales bacterium]